MRLLQNQTFLAKLDFQETKDLGNKLIGSVGVVIHRKRIAMTVWLGLN